MSLEKNTLELLCESLFKLNEKLTEVSSTLEMLDYANEYIEKGDLKTTDQLDWMLRGALRGLNNALGDSLELRENFEEQLRIKL